MYPPSNQRRNPRFPSEFPVIIKVGSQVSIKGDLRDLSVASFFVKLNSDVYLQMNDEIVFEIYRSSKETNPFIEGSGRISRISPGEGIAVYFTQMSEESSQNIDEVILTMKSLS